MSDLLDHDALMGELLEGYQAKLEAAQAENLALLERVARLEKKTSVIYDGYTVWQKCKYLGVDVDFTASSMSTVLDAINAIWKEQEVVDTPRKQSQK